MQRKRVDGPDVHGTGCVLAALIAGRMVATKLTDPQKLTDEGLLEAVRWASGRLAQLRRRPVRIGAGMPVLDVRGAR